MTRKLLLLFVVSTLVVPIAAPASADDLDDDLDKVRDQIAALERQASAVESDRTPILSAALEAQEELDAAEERLAATEAAHDAAAAELAETESRLAAVRTELRIRFAHLEVLRGEVERTREQAKDWVVEAYVRGGTGESGIAFAASAVADISVGVAYLEILTGVTGDAADAFQQSVDAEASEEQKVLEAEAALDEQAARLVRVSAEFETTLVTLDEERAVLAARAAQQNSRLSAINEEIAHFESEISALEREESSIRAAIVAASTPSTSAPGVLIRPVPGAVSSGFGPRVHPIHGTVKMHNGVDMNAGQGQPIKAAGAGIVILSAVKGGYGNTIMIDHGGGMVTLYAHQSQLGASVGEQVSRGQVIGWVGSTGLSTAPHLHFEVRINGAPRNPVDYW